MGARAAPKGRALSATRAAARVPSGGALALDTLSIREVARRHLELKAMLERGAAELDVSALGSIDTAGLQLLLATALAARARGLKLRLLGAQQLMSGAAEMLGLGAHLREIAEIVP
ncbi:MAG: STAS domain-containing protein [Steroidobacteraceae bacterium]|jgi:anti-anti-sigma regulatory factor